MSNELAIAAVTLSLRDMINGEINKTPPAPITLMKEIEVTTLPLQKLGEDAKNQINVFLLNTEPNAAWRNVDLPRVRGGEDGHPPLAINLNYLISTVGEDDNQLVSHYLLGEAMRVLHDNAIIPPAKIKLPESGLGEQLERVTITARSVSIDEISRLWTALQSQYRASALYLVTVLLIESRIGTRAALPVLRRGAGDTGPVITTERSPSIDDVLFDSAMAAARLGDTVVVEGENLSGDTIKVLVTTPRLADPLVIDPEPGSTASRVEVVIPNDAVAVAAWLPGLLMLQVGLERPNVPPWITNSVALPLAPQITVSPLNVVLTGDPAQQIDLDVTCAPNVRAAQQIALLFGDAQLAPLAPPSPPPHPGDPSGLRFRVPPVAGTYVVRLRVDGVDSIPIVRDAHGVMQFDPNQTVTLA